MSSNDSNNLVIIEIKNYKGHGWYIGYADSPEPEDNRSAWQKFINLNPPSTSGYRIKTFNSWPKISTFTYKVGDIIAFFGEDGNYIKHLFFRPESKEVHLCVVYDSYDGRADMGGPTKLANIVLTLNEEVIIGPLEFLQNKESNKKLRIKATKIADNGDLTLELSLSE